MTEDKVSEATWGVIAELQEPAFSKYPEINNFQKKGGRVMTTLS